MNARSSVSRQAGFTLLELVVVGVSLLACIGVMLVLVRPANYDHERRNASRRMDLAVLMLAIADYKKFEGSLPPSITTEETSIGTNQAGGRDLCDDLVPKYLDDLHYDPLLSLKFIGDKVCSAQDQFVVTGYTVRVDESGRVILAAPSTEKEETITVERWFPIL